MVLRVHFPTMHRDFWTMCELQTPQEPSDQNSPSAFCDKLNHTANEARMGIMSKRPLKGEEEFAILNSLHLAFRSVGDVGKIQDVKSGTMNKRKDALFGAIVQEGQLFTRISTVKHIPSLVALRT